ncbi:MAG: hypothetical protein GY851_28380 [bacterium]|nr:hypothetical protein [bacterium]
MSKDTHQGEWVVSRRTFLTYSGAALGMLGGASGCAALGEGAGKSLARFGIATDCHFADREPAGVRFYVESLDKLAECVDLMNQEKVDFLVELGDFKDQDSPPEEAKTLEYLKRIEAVFQQFDGPRYHALGNHDMDSVSKEQFMAAVTNTKIPPERTYYSFDSKGLHVVVLDANFTNDGTPYDHGNFNWTDANIPQEELDWLKADLEASKRPVVVCLHQLLDAPDEGGSVYIHNASAVRSVIEASGKVLAVFQGHHHEGSHSCIEGIHYYTLKAVVEGSGAENNAYAIVDVRPDGLIEVTGYRRVATKALEPAASPV